MCGDIAGDVRGGVRGDVRGDVRGERELREDMSNYSWYCPFFLIGKKNKNKKLFNLYYYF